MIRDEAIVHELAVKVGGRFRLTALLQKRMVELMRGARPLVSSENRTLLQVAIAEVREERIQLVPPTAEAVDADAEA